MKETLTGKKALITGAGAGIGHAIAKSLLSYGADVMAVSRTAEKLERLQNEVKNNQLTCWPIDVSGKEGQDQLWEKLMNTGFPHIVIHNLNVHTPKKRLINFSAKEIAENFTINMDHLFKIMEQTILFQRSEKFGRWIGISSEAAHISIPGQSLYAAQKSMMESFFMNLAVEEGKYGITSNIVCPGFIETPSVKERVPKEIFEKLSSANVLKRAGKPEEVAAAVSFLSQPSSSFITGVILPVSGGAHLGWHYT
ncbi:MAG: SDR family oxidoreductase [Bacteroidetes bacterium]|nr:SDR family oxidoreductase [Bacteroidota bacterium]